MNSLERPHSTSISCNHLYHSYGSTIALSGITVTYQGPGCVALIGANGAGKSTLLRGVVGAHRLTAGEIYLGEDELYPESPARKHIGYLSERAFLPPELSVEEYLWGATVLRGLTKRAGHSALDWVLERCHLKTLAQRRCSTLSRGQQQRARLASALVHQPRLLVLDEVHSGLDPLQTRELNQLLRELAKQSTILLSTHRLSAAEAVADTFWVLHGGHLLASGPLGSWGEADSSLGAPCAETSYDEGALERAYHDLIQREFLERSALLIDQERERSPKV